MWLIELDDAQLQSGLGLTPEDIAVLRGAATKPPIKKPSALTGSGDF